MGKPMAAVQSTMVKTDCTSLKFARMSLIILTVSCNSSLSVLSTQPKKYRLSLFKFSGSMRRNVFCFADRAHPEKFKARFGGEWFEPKN
jgi:hypothetical protein